MTDGPRVGEVFAGRYRIEATLGEGGMGAVYRATDEQVGDVVALKVLLPHGTRPEHTERFRREVRLARRITHPNVARIHDLGEHAGVLYLTMEYIRGSDLQHLVDEEAPLAPARAAELGRKIAEALGAIHAGGVVHRDLKPANVLLEEGGRVVLADFGIARAEVDRDAGFRTAGPIGTPVYMAPEQLTGREVTPKTDLYSLGLVLYELLTGTVPFLAATAMATALARLHQPPPDPRAANRRVPDALAELVLACLAAEPGRRPESAEAVARALAAIAAGDATRPVTTPVALQATAMLPSSPAPRANTLSPGGRALAVLPFKYRGPAEHDYLGDALGDELIDLLSRTRGLTVLASGATQRFRDERDPATVGRELDVDAVVDGAVQASAGRVRVSARLSDAKSGAQLWSERFDSPLEDVFELQDRLGRRIAESLRVGLSTTTNRGDTPAAAIEAYLRARKLMRSSTLTLTSAGGVIELLETCIEEAPSFGPALAAHAMSAIRAWFLPGTKGRDWHGIAEESVARALERAPEIAETQLAASMLALHTGNLAKVAKHAERALEIAPTYAEGHDYLGRLECEAGKPEEGLRRLHLALDLDPTLSSTWVDIARVEALLGNREASASARAKVAEAVPVGHPAILGLDARLAAWSGDEAALRRALAVAQRGNLAMHQLMAAYVGMVLGMESAEDTAERIIAGASQLTSARFRAVVYQMSVEAMALAGDSARAMEFFARATDSVLIDVVWVTRCPALDSLRALPDFARLADVVEQRAGSIWLG